VPEGRSQVSAEQPGAMELEAISGRSGAAQSAPIANLPQEVRDVSALEDLGKDPDPKAVVAADVGASTSLPDLAMGTAANVGATTSLAQTTSRTSRKSDVEVDISVGRYCRLVTSSKSAGGGGQNPSRQCIFWHI